MGWDDEIWPKQAALLAVGDIVILQYDANSYHTVMVTDPRGPVLIGHTEWDGMEIAELKSRAQNSAWVFRSKHTNLAAAAVRYATYWAQPASPGFAMRRGLPPAGYRYSHARGYAVSHEKKAGSPLPFEYEALRRALKWSIRDTAESRFSRNKGTTCCTFVTACYQAAAFSTIERERRVGTIGFMDNVRNAKADWRKLDTDGKGVVLQGEEKRRFPAYKEVSNVGAKEPGALEAAIKMLGGDPAHPNQFLVGQLGSALMVDAKYVYSSVLRDRLEADGDNWKPTTSWKKYEGN